MLSVEKYIKFSSIVSNIEKELQKYKNTNLEEYNLRSTHMQCLISLNDSDGMTAVDLADACAVNKAMISRVASDLLERGYIGFTPDSADKKYRKKMALTEEGKRVVDEIIAKIRHAVTAVSGNIPEEALSVFYDVLFTIEDNIEKLSNNN